MAAPGPDAQGGAGGENPGKDMAALHNLQSMDWLFKKERIFLLAQFWQQVRGASSSSSASALSLMEAAEVSKLVEDISRLQAALSGVKEATAAQMHAMEEQLEEKNRLIQRLELKLQDSSLDEAKRDL
ncbi:putative homeobox protein cut isoform X3, partial [Penaeus vannamei]